MTIINPLYNAHRIAIVMPNITGSEDISNFYLKILNEGLDTKAA